MANNKIVTLPIYFPKPDVNEQSYFQPREEWLRKLAEVLLPSARERDEYRSRDLLSFAISGLGGVGKTRLAREFVIRYKHEFDVILFIKADEVTRMSKQYSQIVVKLGLAHETDQLSTQDCQDALKAWCTDPEKMVIGAGNPGTTEPSGTNLSGTSKVNWLIIFDNIIDADNMDQFYPRTGYGSVLLTSRDPCLYGLEPLATSELKGLASEEAATLLQHASGYPVSVSPDVDRASRVIVDRLEGLPLAIHQIGASITRLKLSIPRFLECFSKDGEKDTAFQELYTGFESSLKYKTNLVFVWKLENFLDQPAFAILCAISMLDPEKIEEELLMPMAQAQGIPNFPTSLESYHGSYRHLFAGSLVDKHPDSGAISVHRLVQQVTRAVVVEKDLAETVFEDVTIRVTLLWPFLNRDYVIGSAGKVGRWARCDMLMPHITKLGHVYREFSDRLFIRPLRLELAEVFCEAAQ